MDGVCTTTPAAAKDCGGGKAKQREKKRERETGRGRENRRIGNNICSSQAGLSPGGFCCAVDVCRGSVPKQATRRRGGTDYGRGTKMMQSRHRWNGR